MNKILCRIKGGLGNQLFCYAAARRLALNNNAELVIDDVTGFKRDREYKSQYALDHFHITARKASPSELLEPFERYRRGLLKWTSRRQPFAARKYIEQVEMDFDERILDLKIQGVCYLDGYWQSENYFKDVEQTIREDLQIIPPQDDINRQLALTIRRKPAVALHIRWFDKPELKAIHNVSEDYYQRAIAFMEQQLDSPQYFLFSDNPEAARAKLSLPEGRVTFVSNNCGQEYAYADLWLMTQCRHFITANSTFSWWGAWLGGGKDKLVVTPDLKISGKTSWGFEGLIPDEWIKL